MKAIKFILGFIIIVIVARIIGGFAGQQLAQQEFERQNKKITLSKKHWENSANQAPIEPQEQTENRIAKLSTDNALTATESGENEYNPETQNKSSSEPSMPVRNSKFTTLRLPLGVSVEVPKNWQIIDGDLNTTIQTASEAVLNLSGVELPKYDRINLFRANSTTKTTYASIAINAIGSEFDPEVLRNASEEEIAAITPVMHKDMQQAFSLCFEIIEFYEVRREFIGEHPAMIIEYKRSGPEGAVIVQMTQLFLGGKIISLNLSYRESEERIWKPIIQYIRNSLKVS